MPIDRAGQMNSCGRVSRLRDKVCNFEQKKMIVESSGEFISLFLGTDIRLVPDDKMGSPRLA